MADQSSFDVVSEVKMQFNDHDRIAATTPAESREAYEQ